METNQVEFLRRIGKQAFVLIYLVMQGRPVSVSELAVDLDINRETALGYLRKLSGEQAATRTRYGWLPTMAGRQLVLPAPRLLSDVQAVDNSVDKVAEIPSLPDANVNKATEIPPSVTEIPPLVTEIPSDVAEIPSVLIINKESLNKDLKDKEQLIISDADVAENPSEVTENPAWEALRLAKVRRNSRTEGIYAAEHLTQEHIQAAEKQLRKRYGVRYSAGLLISMLETIQPGDRPYGHQFGCKCEVCQGLEGNSYAGWDE